MSVEGEEIEGGGVEMEWAREEVGGVEGGEENERGKLGRAGWKWGRQGWEGG